MSTTAESNHTFWGKGNEKRRKENIALDFLLIVVVIILVII